MSRVVFTVRRTIDGIALVFTWSGGAYIDVARQGFGASEVINVWDYEKDRPTIPFTKPAMRAKVKEWIAEYPREQLVHDVSEHW